MASPGKKILMIGPLPPPLGGARVLFKITVDHLNEIEGIEQKIIPLWPLNRPRIIKMLKAARILFQVLLIGGRYDLISFWTSRSGLIYFGPILKVVCFFHKKPLIIRLFGVGYDRPITEYSPLERFLLRLNFKLTDLILVETQLAVNSLKNEYPSGRFFQHKNYRMLPEKPVIPHSSCRRFIYLGRVREDKGILEIIQAAESIQIEDVVVDIYGPFEGGLTEKTFDNCRVVRYCGSIEPDNVPDILGTYHALLLPTTYEGEGHPGVILEAYASGLPVIASNRPSIAEIVDESSGILVPASDSESLQAAMIGLIEDPAKYQSLAAGALAKRQDFSLGYGVERFLFYCDQLLAQIKES